MTPVQLYLLCALLPCMVIGAAIWYRAKFLLRQHGFPVSFFNQQKHMKDFFYLKELIHSEHNPEIKAGYLRLRTTMAWLLAANVILALAFILAVIIPLLSEF